MSLLKWKEMGKSKSALGKKINFVQNAITQKKLGEETSHAQYEKMLRPITTKLDDVVVPNLRVPRRVSLPAQPAKRKKVKTGEIDYYPEVDPFEDMDIEGLFDEAVPPQAKKQISSAATAGPPPSYYEMTKELGDDPPPEYEEDDSPDYALAPGDETEAESSETKEANKLLELLNIRTYDIVDAALGFSDLSATQKRNYLEKAVFPEAIYRRNQLKGYKSSFTKKFKKGEITEEQKNWQHQRIDRSSRALSEYIKHYKAKQKTLTGSGVRRRKGGAVRFFANPKDLLQKLEVIIGSILAGNTNVGIRNTGVEILDLLLKEGVINKSQHEKIFKKYFNP